MCVCVMCVYVKTPLGKRTIGSTTMAANNEGKEEEEEEEEKDDDDGAHRRSYQHGLHPTESNPTTDPSTVAAMDG